MIEGRTEGAPFLYPVLPVVPVLPLPRFRAFCAGMDVRVSSQVHPPGGWAMKNLRLVAALLAISTGCGGETDPPIDGPDPTPDLPTAITITTGSAPPPRFIPRTAGLAAGGTVSFTSGSPVDHTVNSSTSAWPDKTLHPGESFSVTLPTAGQYPYVCSLHEGMTGLIVVQ